jgi:hypothetical protein
VRRTAGSTHDVRNCYLPLVLVVGRNQLYHPSQKSMPELANSLLMINCIVARLFCVSYSARNDGSSGERNTAAVATSDAASPVTAMAASNTASDAVERRPPRA